MINSGVFLKKNGKNAVCFPYLRFCGIIGRKEVFKVTKAFPRCLIALFFAAFLLLGLLTAADYGASWDEMDEMDILRMNLWEYTRAFGMDESAFEKRASQFDEALTISRLTPISESIEQDHGISAFYPMAKVVMSEELTEAQRSEYWHMWCWVIFTLGAFALYAVLRELGVSRSTALLGPVFLLLSPQFFAHGHFNNKDIALLSLVLCTLWRALRLMKKPTFANGLLFSLAGAFAANTKLAGLAVWGLCALFVLLYQIVHRNMKGRVWAVAGVTAASFFAFYALITPAMWASPVTFVKYLVQNAMAFTRWQNALLFRSTVFELWRESLPVYYLPYMILATTPVWVTALAAIGAIAGLVRVLRKKEEALGLVLTACLLVLPLGFAIATHTHVYNGWRHFYFVYGPMLVLAVFGVHAIRPKKRWLKNACALVLTACMAFSCAGIISQHPYQQAYYQSVVQLRGTDFNELDYWNVSARDALKKLADHTQGDLTIQPADLWTEDALAKALLLLDETTAQRFTVCENAQYVLANPTYVNFSGFDAEGMAEAVCLTSYGQPIMRIYERVPKGE